MTMVTDLFLASFPDLPMYFFFFMFGFILFVLEMQIERIHITLNLFSKIMLSYGPFTFLK